MNILCTGSNGYIGSVVVDELIEKGHTVVAVDNLVRGHKDALNSKAEFWRGDIGVNKVYDYLFPKYKIEAVIHLAGATTVEASMTNPSLYFQENVVKGVTLLDAMKRHGVKKIIFSSSATVYGQTGNRACKEDDELKPISAYGESKFIFEKMMRWYKLAYGFDCVAFRYFNVAGATELRGQDHKPETSIVPSIIQSVIQGKVFNVYGTDYPTDDGTCVRDYVHVSDIARAHVLALEKIDAISGMAFNLSSIKGYSVMDVVNAAREALGTVVPTIPCPRREGDPAVLLADSTLARIKLGWTPQYTDMKGMIKSAWDWQVKHPNGYEK